MKQVVSGVGMFLMKLSEHGVTNRHWNRLAKNEAAIERVAEFIKQDYEEEKQQQQQMRDKESRLLSCSVKRLNLPSELLDLLIANGIKTVRDLIRMREQPLRDMGLSEDDLMQILQALDEHGGKEFCFELASNDLEED